MSLRKKTFLVILFSVIVILVIWGIFAHTLYLRSSLFLESVDVREDAGHLLSTLDSRQADFSALCTDWAAWDDTYQFMSTRDPAFLESNFPEGTFENLDLNFALILDSQRDVQFQKAYDLELARSIPLKTALVDYFQNPELAAMADETAFSGFLWDENAPVMYCISPILTSADQGPSRGWLVFGRYLQGDFLKQIEDSISSLVTILPYNPAQIPSAASLLPLQDENGREIAVVKPSSSQIEFYSLFHDFQGAPIFIIWQAKYRAIYQQGLSGLRSMLIAIILTGTIAGGFILIFLDKALLARLSKLHDAVIAVRQGEGDYQPLSLSGSDEISGLSIEFDRSLKTLVEKQRSINGFLRYAQLMTEISSRFINLPINKIDQNLQEVLGRLGNYLDVDFGFIAAIDQSENHAVTQFFEWVKPGKSSLKKEILALDIGSLRWALREFKSRKPVIFSNPGDIPSDAVVERKFIQNKKITSIIAFPLIVAEDFFGILAFGLINQERSWDEQTTIVVEIISTIISNAIDRKQTEMDLQAGQRFQYRLNQITRTGIERDGCNSSIRALSRNLRSLLNIERNWLILLDEIGRVQVFESGVQLALNEEVLREIEYLSKRVREEEFIFQADKRIRKVKGLDFEKIGKSFIAIPLSAKNQHLGLILFASPTPRLFSELEIGICQQAATQISLTIIKNRSLEESRKISRELRILRSEVVEFSSELQRSRLQSSILERAVKLLRAEGGEFLIYDEKNRELITVSSLNLDKDYSGMRTQVGEGAVGKAVAQRKTVAIRDYSSWSGRMPAYEESRIKASLSAPLIFGEKILGCISVFHYDDGIQFTGNDQHLLTIFAQHASVAMENAILFEQLQEAASTDDMTGLLNRRALFEFGDYEISRSIRLERPLAVVMMDLDNYKEINDTHSHLVGDRVLKEVSRLLRENVRTIDIIGRYGGDEFVIIMPETSLDEAVKAMERVRRKLERTVIRSGSLNFHVTASFGVTHHSQGLPALEILIEEADKAMYAAKTSGRNGLRVFQQL